MKVEKAYAISDAKISYMSLVDKAANLREFLITKAENGVASFTTTGKIIKVDNTNHYVTGIAYEPMVEDAHGNYMTEEEIIKAAYWFAKNGDKVDLQHSFEELSNASVVENWVTKSEEVIGDTTVAKGTWLVTVEISDSDLWSKIQKGEVTGFSIGGVGKYSTDDVDLDAVEKEAKDLEANTPEKKGIFKKFAEALGFEVVEKGQVAEQFANWQKGSGFWNAVDALTEMLCNGHWDYGKDAYVYDFEDDEEKVREALTDFNAIIADVLLQESVTKAIFSSAPERPILKAGKKMSTKNKQKLDEIASALADFAKEFEENNNEEEETDMTKDDIQKMIDEAITKAATPPSETPPKAEELTAEAVQKMIDAAVQKATQPEPQGEAEALTADAVQDMISKALAPVLKARGISTNLNDETEPVKKEAETHYLHGIL